TEIVKGHSYTAEEHTVYSDGYELVLHRISGSPSRPSAPGKPVVYMQHGIFMWSVNLILRGPGKDLVFLLADAGYDVWIGNARGNSYSRSHDTLKPDDSNFWDFSYQEIGLGDVKAFIDHALNVTEQESLTYIGYSAGAAEGFILLSSITEYNDKVNLFIGIAPSVFWNHASYSVQLLSQAIRVVENTKYYVGVGPTEIFSRSTGPRPVEYFCGKESGFTRTLCNIVFTTLGPIKHTTRLSQEILTAFMRAWPAGTSDRFLFHFGQNMRSGLFQAYDFGYKRNLEEYGSAAPPPYDLSKVTSPVALYFGGSDVFVATEDIESLKESLPKVVEYQKINDFDHLDFILFDDLEDILYSPMIKLISKYSDGNSRKSGEDIATTIPNEIDRT
ncbi:hypothetical protein QAD02_003905, partial [Eretmocerus hayati]